MQCHSCGVVAVTDAERVQQVFKWDVDTDTFVINIQRFTSMTLEGKHNTWRKDKRTIEVPLTLPIKNVVYMLVAVVGHKGDSMHNGHYTAMTRNAVDGTWCYCNDNAVTSFADMPII